jgi:hypothetical protein
MSRIHNLMICSCILVLTSTARAEGDLNSIIKSRTTAELLQTIQKNDLLSKDSNLCREQLRSHKVPYACFRLLEAEQSELKPSSKTNRAGKADWLELNCERAAERSTHQRELILAIKSGARLPLKCRNAIQQRLDDLNYTAETENPLLRFEGRND